MVERIGTHFELGQGPHKSLDIFSRTNEVDVPMGDMLVPVQGVFGALHGPNGNIAVGFGIRYVTHADRPDQCMTHALHADPAPILPGILGMRVLHEYMATHGSFGQHDVPAAIAMGVNDFFRYSQEAQHPTINHPARTYAYNTAEQYLTLTPEYAAGIEELALLFVNHGQRIDLDLFNRLDPDDLAQVPFVASMLKDA